MTLETLQQYVQTLTNEKDEHIIRQLCAIIISLSGKARTAAEAERKPLPDWTSDKGRQPVNH